jgi:hypothetical protein
MPASRQRPTDGAAPAKPGIREAAHAQVPQQLTQLVGVAAPRSRPHARGVAQQESGHIPAREALHPRLILGRDSFRDEPACHPVY